MSKIMRLLIALLLVGCLIGERQPSGEEEMPGGLMNAILAASARPFEASAQGYHTISGGLDFALEDHGLRAGGSGIAWNIAFSGLGREADVKAFQQAVPVQTGNRLEYHRGSLTEWYRSTALGVEQGFTIHQAPTGAGPLILQLDLSTALVVNTDADGSGLSFTAENGECLRYDHLRAWDARGAPLEAKMDASPGQVRLIVNDRGAVYPITIDPLVYLEQKVITPGLSFEKFGYSVAISGDTALVGAYGQNSERGMVYVFVRTGTIWTLQARLSDDMGAMGDRFGYSVALSGDTALVGSYLDDIGAKVDQGSAFLFTRSGTTWSYGTRLVAQDGEAGDNFGYSVALDGDTALIGAVLDDVGANVEQGSAYAFTGSGTTWAQQAQLTDHNGQAGDNFGNAVALSGETALVAAYNDDVGSNIDQGSASIFTRSGITWTKRSTLTANDGRADDHLGWSVALSGTTALVGAPVDDVGTQVDQGSAYIFVQNGNLWGQQARLTAADGLAQHYFGVSVALSGYTALVGEYNDLIFSNMGQGSAYVFNRSGTVWSQQQKLVASDGAAGDYFGYSVALSGDTLLVGAYSAEFGASTDQGAVYVFTCNGGAGCNVQQKLTPSDGEAGDWFGWSVAISQNTALVGVRNEDAGRGSAYVFVRSGSGWVFQARLIAPDGMPYDHFGNAVALDGNTALVGAYLDDLDQPDEGSAYVFIRSGTTWSYQAKLYDYNYAGEDDQFGWSVALSGNTALVGVPYFDDSSNVDQGRAYFFTRTGTTWAIQTGGTQSTPGYAGDWFGWSVALSGSKAIIGAIGASTTQGAAYVFTSNGVTWTQQARLVPADGATGIRFGGAVALSGGIALVGAELDDVGSNARQGSAYVFSQAGTTWIQQAELAALDGAVDDRFGSSVALYLDTALVGAYLDDVGPSGADQGSAYVFIYNGTGWVQRAKLTASDAATNEHFGRSVSITAGTALVGAGEDDIGPYADQGSVYFYQAAPFAQYLPTLKKAP